jgi:hypothetical protein
MLASPSFGHMEEHMAKNENSQEQPCFADLREGELNRVISGQGTAKDLDKFKFLVVTLADVQA